MTNKPTITQADRDAAIDLAEALDFPATVAWLKTETDKPHLFSEAFAKHRESSVAELQAEVERLRDILARLKEPNSEMLDAGYKALLNLEVHNETRPTIIRDCIWREMVTAALADPLDFLEGECDDE